MQYPENLFFTLNKDESDVIKITDITSVDFNIGSSQNNDDSCAYPDKRFTVCFMNSRRQRVVKQRLENLLSTGELGLFELLFESPFVSTGESKKAFYGHVTYITYITGTRESISEICATIKAAGIIDETLVSPRPHERIKRIAESIKCFLKGEARNEN